MSQNNNQYRNTNRNERSNRYRHRGRNQNRGQYTQPDRNQTSNDRFSKYISDQLDLVQLDYDLETKRKAKNSHK